MCVCSLAGSVTHALYQPLIGLFAEASSNHALPQGNEALLLLVVLPLPLPIDHVKTTPRNSCSLASPLPGRAVEDERSKRSVDESVVLLEPSLPNPSPQASNVSLRGLRRPRDSTQIIIYKHLTITAAARVLRFPSD